MHLLEARASHGPAIAAFLAAQNATHVARRGELVNAAAQQALIVVEGEEVRGVLTYTVRGQGCEILTLHVEPRQAGHGTALIESIAALALRRGCSRLWLITTNDNVDALRFYQRRGFVFTALHPGAVAVARQSLKPEIPLVGDYGIPLRDELELERTLH